MTVEELIEILQKLPKDWEVGAPEFKMEADRLRSISPHCIVYNLDRGEVVISAHNYAINEHMSNHWASLHDPTPELIKAIEQYQQATKVIRERNDA